MISPEQERRLREYLKGLPGADNIAEWILGWADACECHNGLRGERCHDYHGKEEREASH